MWQRNSIKFLYSILVLLMICGQNGLCAEDASVIDTYRAHKNIVSEADHKAQEGFYLDAAELYRQAEEKFKTLKGQFPEWPSMILVDIQIDRCHNKVQEMNALAEKEKEFQNKYNDVLELSPPQELTQDVQDQVQSHINLADGLLKQQEYQAALRHYEQALAVLPNHPHLLLSKAVCLFKLNQVERSMSILKKLIIDFPDFPGAFYNLADVYYSLGDLDRAVETYEKAIQLDGEDIRSRVNLGVIYVKQKRYNKALDLFLQAIRKDESCADAYYNLGVIYSDYLFDRDQAIFYYQKYLDVAPNGDDHELIQQWIKELMQGREKAHEMAKE